MGHYVLPGNPPVEVTLRRSARARRISLRVSGVDGRVTLTVPPGVAERTALDFANEKAAWLRTQLSRQPDMADVRIGSDLPVEGRLRRIAPGFGRRIQLAEDALNVPGPPETAPRRIQAWLKIRARDQLAAASDHHAQAIDRKYTRLTLRDTRSRWGSCTHDAGLMYSWRLILAPGDVLDYVAAHEVAHLVEMNHSRAFWDIVARLCPGYDAPRRWLRENGAELHRYRFD